jgi:hypothetical protein
MKLKSDIIFLNAQYGKYESHADQQHLFQIFCAVLNI